MHARTALGSESATWHIKSLLTGATDDPRVVRLLDGRFIEFALAMSHLLGAALLRYVTKSPPVADLDFQAFVARIAPAVQLHLGEVHP